MTPEIHPVAAEELLSAVLAYERFRTGLGADLRAEVGRVTLLLCDLPRIGERLDTGHRRFPLRRFPFALVYRSDGQVLRIVAVTHQRRSPGYWRQRD